MNWIRQLEGKLTLPMSWSLHWEAAVWCSAGMRGGQGAGLFHTMPPTLPGGQEARKVCGRATGMTSGALVGRGNHGTLEHYKQRRKPPGLASSSKVTASRSRAWEPKVILATPGLAGGGHRGGGGDGPGGGPCCPAPHRPGDSSPAAEAGEPSRRPCRWVGVTLSSDPSFQ